MTQPQNPFDGTPGLGGPDPLLSQSSSPYQAPAPTQDQLPNQTDFVRQEPALEQYSGQSQSGGPQSGASQVMSPAYAVAPNQVTVAGPPKKMIVAALLAFFLGGFGAHNFYLGNQKKAITQLGLLIGGSILSVVLVGVLVLLGLEVWVIAEFIMLLIGTNGYDRDARGVPLER